MDSNLQPLVGERYKSLSQRSRVMTERWTRENLPCPACGGRLVAYPTNTKVYDFFCEKCSEKFQLKSSRSKFGKYALGGEYFTMMSYVKRDIHPSLILLEYSKDELVVCSVSVVHRSCITLDSVIPRKRLSSKARRSGWKGCKISLVRVPPSAMIRLVTNGLQEAPTTVNSLWVRASKILVLRPQMRGWLADVLASVERLEPSFSTKDIYSFEGELGQKHPGNQHVREKIRQQLQELAKIGLIHRVAKGHYQRV